MNDKDIIIDNLYLIPANTEFWSIALQLYVKTNKDLILKVTNKTCYGNIVFGILQYVHLPLFIDNGESYPISTSDHRNGDISIKTSNLEILKYDDLN